VSEEYHPTGCTAIVIVPPQDVIGYADHYRSLYMPNSMHHIEPHITLTCPFVPYERLEEAEPRLRSALARCAPIWVSLRGFSMFSDAGILYLRPAKAEPIYSVYRAILAEFPEHPAYGGKHGDDWQPHMTVGKFSNPEELRRVHEELAVQRLFIGFEVEQVVLKCEMDDGMWDTWAELPLAGESPSC
jgi:2'-5' RNA ligase